MTKKYKYLVTKVCNVPKGCKVFYEHCWHIENYCAIAAALNTDSIDNDINDGIDFIDLEDYQFGFPELSESFCLIRTKL